MLLVADVLPAHRSEVPADYGMLPMMKRLYLERSKIQAITHVDFSARLQTVHKDTNPRYWGLIDRFREKTGCGLVVNTSFNVRGEPIICSPEHAYRCFMRTEMDYLVIGDYLFAKTEQPFWQDKARWAETFKLD
jgi:carbamoyltransferase